MESYICQKLHIVRSASYLPKNESHSLRNLFQVFTTVYVTEL
jgi:hypothetical protein